MKQQTVAALTGAAFLISTFGAVVAAVGASPCPAGSTCGSMGPMGPPKPVPVGPTTITYPTNHPPKTPVFEPPKNQPVLPRSPEATAGRKAYCAKNPFKCGEGG